MQLPPIGFLGTGKMATALAGGFIRSGLTPAEMIYGSDVIAAGRDSFRTGTGAFIVEDNTAVLKAARVIFLAVKPNQMEGVCREAAPLLTAEHLIISIAAGVTLAQLEKWLGERRIIRVMPNTPCLVGAGASAFSCSRLATSGDADLTRKLLGSVGLVEELPEKLLDAVTGLSGSGPAYAFQMIEALSDGGVRMGLPRSTATRLAAQTLLGAAEMVLETGEHPGQLKDAVTSPGGTTIAGLHALERGGLRAALMDAVEAATLRSQELGAR